MSHKCVGCGALIKTKEVACETCMSVPQRPCYKCLNRVASPNCHDTCRDYIIRSAINVAIKSGNVGFDADVVRHDSLNRCIKRQHRKVKIRPKGDWKH